MFIEAMILGLIVGIASKGRISNLFSLNIRGWYLIIIGVLIQYMPLLFNMFKINILNFNYFTVVGNLILLFVVLINIEINGFFIILIGGIINLFGFVINGFKMPIIQAGVSEKMIQLINSNNVLNYKLINEISNWKFYLGKIIVIPDIYPFYKVLSVGDIIIMIGLVVLVEMKMKKTYFEGNGRMLKFNYQ
jgi:hypothetical protein